MSIHKNVVSFANNMTEWEKNTPPTINESEKEKPSESLWGELFRFAIIAALIVLPFRYFIAQPFIVKGVSMSPTFETGEYLIVDEISYRFNNPERGDVVIVKKPGNTSENLIKRIMGLPGETLRYKNNVLTVINKENPDGLIISEPYLTNIKTSDFEATLGNDQYFVMGDNRPVSLDSRIVGPVRRDAIIGEALLRLFPPTRISYYPGGIK
ncbi:MAG: signal peptidase I [Parcubacteria group bacterium LiPW_30]|nr:MAG: signal peptidase I [Parcubacteria group bacterium LiPW_30]